MSDHWILLVIMVVLLFFVYTLCLSRLLVQKIRDRLCARRESILARGVCPRCQGPLLRTEQHIEAKTWKQHEIREVSYSCPKGCGSGQVIDGVTEQATKTARYLVTRLRCLSCSRIWQHVEFQSGDDPIVNSSYQKRQLKRSMRAWRNFTFSLLVAGWCFLGPLCPVLLVFSSLVLCWKLMVYPLRAGRISGAVTACSQGGIRV